MFYKVINTESEVYKKLYELRTKELAIDESNLKLIEEKIGLNFDIFYGTTTQQNLYRTKRYDGFVFTEKDKIDSKIWRKKKGENFYEPNLRTRIGKEMKNFLNNLQSSYYDDVFDILGITRLKRFVFPYMDIFGDIILIYLDNNHIPEENKDVIEITSNEWNEIFNIYTNETSR